MKDTVDSIIKGELIVALSRRLFGSISSFRT